MEQKDFLISGIQQIGVGTTSVYGSWKWYIDMFGIDINVLEDDTVAERMLPYTGGQAQKRHAAIALNVQGGGGFEIWQYSERKPKPADFEVSAGDIGIFAAKVRCLDVKAAHAQLAEKWNGIGKLGNDPAGSPTFFLKDLEGNTFQLVEDKQVCVKDGKLFGGMVGAMIGVEDMERSIRFYQEVLGYDNIIYDVTGNFEDLAFMNGGSGKFRRVALRWMKPTEGAFSEMFTCGTIELVQALERVPQRIFEGRYWGDPGFIQVCYDVTDMDAFGRHCAALGHPFTVDSCPDGKQFNMGDASGRFTYIEDPDGTLIELVETYRIAIAKRFGWYIDLMKRNRKKPLCKLLFHAMKLNRKKF